MFWSFHPLADKTNHEHLPKHFSRSYENRYQQPSFMSLGRPICKELRQRTHSINSSRSQLRRQQFEANIHVRDPMDWGILKLFNQYNQNPFFKIRKIKLTDEPSRKCANELNCTKVCSCNLFITYTAKNSIYLPICMSFKVSFFV